MKINIIFLLFFSCFFSLGLYAQELEKIVIKKEKTFLYRGVNQEVSDWYLHFGKDSIVLLANLTIPQDEIENWFEIRKDSDNIFRGKITENQFQTITFIKRNDQETSMSFYLNFEEKDRLILTSIEHQISYNFLKK
jgi:hypothetical protein